MYKSLVCIHKFQVVFKHDTKLNSLKYIVLCVTKKCGNKICREYFFAIRPIVCIVVSSSCCPGHIKKFKVSFELLLDKKMVNPSFLCIFLCNYLNEQKQQKC